MTKQTIIKTALAAAKSNNHILLAGVAIVGIGLVIYTAYKAGKEIPDAMKKAEDKKGEALTKVERAVVVAKCAWVTAVVAVLSAGCIVASTKISDGKIDQLAKAYEHKAEMLGMHIAKEAEVAGSETAEKIQKAVGEELKKVASEPEPEVWLAEHTNKQCLYRDCWTGRMFWSTPEKINEAFRRAAMRINREGVCYLSELYEYLGLDADIGCADSFGFDREELYGIMIEGEYAVDFVCYPMEWENILCRQLEYTPTRLF